MMTKSVAQSNGRGDGFTLVELIVVIAIITLLLSILMPALNKAKELGKQAVCLSHTRQLTLAWRLYADGYDGKIPQSDVDEDIDITAFGWVTKKASMSDKDKIASIEDGVLFPYTDFVSMYRCPSAKKGEFRSYSIVSSMNATKNASNKQGPIYTNLTKITSSSDMIVFICEGAIGKKDNSFSIIKDNSFSIIYNAATWGDLPPLTHNNGTIVSFVDGHTESWVWQDRDTILLGKDEITQKRQSGNPDLERVQRGIWGSLGYNPDPLAP